MAEKRHIGFGPGYQYDYTKSAEENRALEVEYYKKRYGIDIERPDPKIKAEMDEFLKSHDKQIDDSLKRTVDKMKNEGKGNP
jgi:hypothetical protein